MPEAAPRLCVYTRAWRTSGAGLFAQELVLGLVEAGAHVTFVCPRIDNPALDAPRPGLTRLRPPRERTDGAAAPLRALWSAARILGSVMSVLAARLRARTYIVSIPDPLPATIAALLLLRLTGARIVYVAHDPVPHAWRLGTRWQWLELASYGLCYRLASAVVVLSEPSRAKLTAAFPRLRTAVAVIEHGVFVLGEPSPAPGDGTLLCFGTIRRNKGIAQGIQGVISAQRSGAPVRLIVAGEAHREDPGYAEECAVLARSAPDVIAWRPGYVADDTLPALIAEADALLLPYTSFFSQSGVAILAASNARPVIGTGAGGLGTLFDEGMPGTVIATPVSSGTVAQAVTAFAAVPAATWRERAMAYRETMLERRSWHAIARRYLALVEQQAR